MWIFANKNQLKLLFMCVGKWQEELFTFVEPSALSIHTRLAKIELHHYFKLINKI